MKALLMKQERRVIQQDDKFGTQRLSAFLKDSVFLNPQWL